MKTNTKVTLYFLAIAITILALGSTVYNVNRFTQDKPDEATITEALNTAINCSILHTIIATTILLFLILNLRREWLAYLKRKEIEQYQSKIFMEFMSGLGKTGTPKKEDKPDMDSKTYENQKDVVALVGLKAYLRGQAINMPKLKDYAGGNTNTKYREDYDIWYNKLTDLGKQYIDVIEALVELPSREDYNTSEEWKAEFNLERGSLAERVRALIDKV